VPALLLASPEPLGALSGLVWVDTNKDGYQTTGEPILEGIPVALFRTVNGVDQPFGTTVTDANGGYLFDYLPVGDGYWVQFGITGLDAQGNGYVYTEQDAGGTESGYDAIDSDADATTGRTGQYTVVANTVTEHVDAGVYGVGAIIEVEKYSRDITGWTLDGTQATAEATAATKAAEPLTITALPDDPQTYVLPVRFSFTNAGEEALTNLTFADATEAGPPVTWTSCMVLVPSPGTDQPITFGAATGTTTVTIADLTTPDPADTIDLTADVQAFPPGFTLAAGGTVECAGTVTLGRDQSHADTVLVTGQGVQSHKVVHAQDGWAASVSTVNLRLDVIKEAFWASDVQVSGANATPIPVAQTIYNRTPDQVVWRYTVTNAGALPAVGVTLADTTVSASVPVVVCTGGGNPVQNPSSCAGLPLGGLTLQPGEDVYLWSARP
jgi:hypothetical protein